MPSLKVITKFDPINLDKIIEVAKGLYNICLERMVELVRSWLLLEVDQFELGNEV